MSKKMENYTVSNPNDPKKAEPEKTQTGLDDEEEFEEFPIQDLSSAIQQSAMADHSFEYLALPYDEFDVLVTDINEKELERIGEAYDIKHLSPGSFSYPAFPVNGKIYDPNLRFMVPLVCQPVGKPDLRVINIWFLIDTGSPFTCLSLKSLEAFFGQGNVVGDDDKFYPMAIQDQNSNIQCRISKEHYKDVNILGANAMRDLELSAIEGINWRLKTFRLVMQ
uniref:Uncharacterized protein n=1 Tax=Acrobeloides nanus TaxID=290746 RepID=A0A914CJN9_9BILA